MRKIKSVITRLLFYTAIYASGFGMGLCVKVFLVRGAPVINGGGEFMLLFLVPATWYIGFRHGCNKENEKYKDNGGDGNE